MIGVYLVHIIVSGVQGMCDGLFDKPEQCFPVINCGNSRCALGSHLSVIENNGILEMNQTMFAKNMVEQYNIPTT